MAGVKQTSASSSGQQGFVLFAYGLSVVLGTALLLLFLAGRSSLLGPSASVSSASEEGCCPELLGHLAATVDESVDPCTDFFRYACGDAPQRIRRRDYEDSWFYSQLWLPALTGEARDEASIMLRRLYVSCVRNDFDPKHAFADAGAALREALNVRSTNALNVPALIVKITAVLRIDFFVRMRSEQAQGYTVEVLKEEANSIEQHAFTHVGDTAKVFELRDTPLDLTSIHRDVLEAMADAQSERSKIASKGRIDVHENASWTMGGQMMWRTALALEGLWHQRMRIYCDDPLLLQRLMRLLMVFWQDMSVIYVFHLSTWNLVRSSIGDRYTLAFPGPWQDSCSRELKQYPELWAAAAAYKKSSGATDLIVASLVDDLVSQVQSDSEHLFPDTSFSVERQLSFLLPAQLFQDDWSVPNASEVSYWAHKLMVNEWLTGTVLSSSRAGLHGMISRRRIFLAADLYADVREDAGDRMFVNDALVGVDLATQMWQVVLNYVTSRNSANATRFLSCLQNTIGQRSVAQAALFLSVRSILRMRSTVDWDRLSLSVGSLKPFSNSRLFYVMYLNQGLCKKALRGLETADNVVAYADVLRHVSHFQKAFKCFPRGVKSKYCFDHNTL